MGTVNVVLGEDTRLNLILGQQLENAVTEVVFDFSAWKTTYGTGTLALSVQRPGDDQPYAVALTTSGTNATWSVTNLDTAYKGVGHIQLTYTVGSAIKKSVVYKFTVYESLGANGEYPSPGQTWQEGIEDDIEGLRTDVDADHDELIDIREGADGVTYPSAGDAVRGQITDVKSDLGDLSDLETTDKSSLVNAINEAAQSGGSGTGLSDNAKQALLACFQNVAWIDEDGQDYYDALENALYSGAQLSYISAVYTQTGTVLRTDSLDSLKEDLVVTAHYSNGSYITITNYTLSGTLSVGTSVITVSYEGKTTTFNVTVSPRIPSTYQEVEYIQSDGTQLILTDIIPRNTRTLVTFEYIDFRASNDNFITGVYNANSQRYYAAWVNSDGYITFHNRNNNILWTGPKNPTGIHTIDYNNAQHQALYDDEIRATSADFAITSEDGKLGIFSRGDNADWVSIARIYSLKYENNDTGNAIGEFVPCYRKADDVVGMYDLVSQQFYTDYLGGNPFAKGNDVD